MRRLSLIIGISLLAFMLASCGQPVPSAGLGNAQSAPDLSQRPINVVTTIGMITDIVQQVGGTRIQVQGLMGAGVDPHLYKASEGDVGRLAEADVVFYNGLNLEAGMGEVLKRMAGLGTKTVAVAEGIDRAQLLASAEYTDQFDPHVWFDVTLWMQAVEKVRDTLVAMDQGSAQLYQANAQQYLAQLTDLHTYAKTEIARIPATQRVLVTAHDAFHYFGRAYDIDVRGLQGISTAAEAGTADVQELAAFIAERKIPAIFVESSVPQRNIEAVQAAVKAQGHSVTIGGELFSDAMGNPGTPEGSYIGMVRHNVDTIVKALSS